MNEDIETIVKKKIALEEEIKNLKQKIIDLEYKANFYKKEVENYKDKIDEACKILIKRTPIVFWKRKGFFKRKRRFNI
jgi:predicted  nucleic acid-binding Zn-ribbon protein